MPYARKLPLVDFLEPALIAGVALAMAGQLGLQAHLRSTAQSPQTKLMSIPVDISGRFRQVGQGLVPEVVRRLAESFLSAQAQGGAAENDKAQHEEFARFFFYGFTIPDSGLSPLSPLQAAAFGQGQRYRDAYPEEEESIFAGYGYTRVQAIGQWTSAWEISGFTPVDGTPGYWRLVGLPGLKTNIQRLYAGPFNSIKFKVKVVGYLSPLGYYGHLGSNDRELYATSLMRVR